MATRTTKKKPAARTRSTPARPPAARSTSSRKTTAATAAASTSEASSPGKWPALGYDGPEPWDLAADHLDANDEAYDRVHGDDPEPYLGPGAVTHSMPLLTQGTADATFPTPVVSELARRLKELGYVDNTITHGENAAGVLDASVWASVQQFQRDHNVRENIGGFAGGTVPPQDLVDRHVGPYTWQALIELSDEAERERLAFWKR